MKIIETEYKGYKFRSRLEARWAVFFDACNVRWEYEPEGYDLGDELYYLPDFLLHNVKIYYDSGYFEYEKDFYAEVKGKMTEIDAKKIVIFADYDDKKSEFDMIPFNNPIIILPSISMNYGNMTYESDESFYEYDIQPVSFQFINAQYDCPALLGIDKQKNFSVFVNIDVSNLKDLDYKLTEKAYKKALQKRFEKN